MAHAGRNGRTPIELPPTPIDRITAPVAQFLHVEATSGAVLLTATFAALALANSAASDAFLGLWKTPVGFRFGDFAVEHSLKHWINDGLMAIFFFVIGLEVKRELVMGELRDVRRAALPIAAAIGGMVVPAGLYLALQAGEPGARGWGIPMATDIAFVVGCMAVLGPRVPHGLRVLLLSLAIADDIGAILVIAVGYTETIHMDALLLALAGVAAIPGLARLGVRSRGVYTLLGAGIWFGFHESGVHATIAGVALGLLTPARAYLSQGSVRRFLENAGSLSQNEPDPSFEADEVRRMRTATREFVSPLEDLERLLHPWVAFVIMPLFALANAGVPISAGAIADPVAVAVATGLVVGKPVGILAVSFLAVRTGLARLPQGVGWGAIGGGGLLAGIGFTMALFIASLALAEPLLSAAKVGILAASALAAVAGMIVLLVVLPRRGAGPAAATPDE